MDGPGSLGDPREGFLGFSGHVARHRVDVMADHRAVGRDDDHTHIVEADGHVDLVVLGKVGDRQQLALGALGFSARLGGKPGLCASAGAPS